MAETMPTYYDVLKVERDATPERVRAAYRKLAQKYHPDKMPDNANASRAMAAINAAYEVLSDGHRRAEHDLWIRRAERPSEPARPAPFEPPTDIWTFLHPSTSWPWYLLFGTLLFAVGTILTAVYMTAMPARAAVVSTAQPCKLSGPAAPTRCVQR
jgi:curved DNA-binding protein CbpA